MSGINTTTRYGNNGDGDDGVGDANDNDEQDNQDEDDHYHHDNHGDNELAQQPWNVSSAHSFFNVESCRSSKGKLPVSLFELSCLQRQRMDNLPMSELSKLKTITITTATTMTMRGGTHSVSSELRLPISVGMKVSSLLEMSLS